MTTPPSPTLLSQLSQLKPSEHFSNLNVAAESDTVPNASDVVADAVKKSSPEHFAAFETGELREAVNRNYKPLYIVDEDVREKSSPMGNGGNSENISVVTDRDAKANGAKGSKKSVWQRLTSLFTGRVKK